MPVVDELTQVRCFIKERLQRDYTTFRGHEKERENVHQLLQRTCDGESNSLLLVGPRGVGKTTLVNAVVADLLKKSEFLQNTLLVLLNGYLHTDDKLALKSITVQMQLKNAVEGKVFGSFAENLAFLLACLKSGGKQSKSVIFIIEEFDLFCTHHNQTLLYNLFDVSQSAQAPICVLGLTCRLDVVELLEKRVKSRFSHRQIFLFPKADDFSAYRELCQSLLSIPSDSEMKCVASRMSALQQLKSNAFAFKRAHFNPSKYKFSKKFTDAWNKNVASVFKEPSVVAALQNLFDFDITEVTLKLFLYRLIAQIRDDKQQSRISAEQIVQLAATYEIDHKVELLCGLSVLELCLVIAIKHHSEIYDRDPFNFEIIFTRFNKFSKISTTMQGIERGVALKAFERLRVIEFILPLSSTTGKVQKEFEMHKVALTNHQIGQAVQKYQALPTEINLWAQSSII